MDQGSYWHDYIMVRSHVFLALGAISTFGALISTLTGKTWDRYRGLIVRAKDPKRFRDIVATLYVLGVVLLGLYLYTIT